MRRLETKLYSQMLSQCVQEYGDHPALTCQGKTITFRQLKTGADRCSLALHRAGFQKGDRAVLWGFNGIEWMIAFYGITQIGGVAALMNYGLKAVEVSALSRMVGAFWGIIGGNVVSIQDKSAAVRALGEGGVPVEHVFPAPVFASPEAFVPLSEEEQSLVDRLTAQTAPKDSQVIIYTTGTTSVPKAVLQSSYSILSNVEGSLMVLGDKIESPFCLALPAFHSYGLMVANSWLMMGYHVFLSPLLKPDVLLELLYLYLPGIKVTTSDRTGNPWY